jgi:hypothetical protein
MFAIRFRLGLARTLLSLGAHAPAARKIYVATSATLTFSDL